MAILYNNISIAAPLAYVWAVLSDLEALEKYDPTVARSEVISEIKTGTGSSRKVHMADGKNWFEEIITEWQPNQELEIRLTNCTFPIKRLRHSYRLTEDDGNTVVYQVMDYQVKYGIPGKILDS